MTFSFRPRSSSRFALGSLGEYPCGFLEGGRRDEAVGGERCLGDTEQQVKVAGPTFGQVAHPHFGKTVAVERFDSALLDRPACGVKSGNDSCEL
jgi:hypothetical protein